MRASGPSIVAVAIGRNEGERLVRCLTSLVAEAIPIVYVDSASTDGSIEAARRHGAHVLPLDMSRPFSAARARGEGFALAEELVPDLDYVMFIDGDCELEWGWLPAALRFLDGAQDFAVACGRRRERFPTASLYNAVAEQEWDTPVGEAAACGGDAVFRAAAYRAAQGFDPRLIAGEEPELCARLRHLGWRVMRLDAPMTIHDAATFRFAAWWRRAIRSGFGYAQAWRATRAKRAGRPLYGRELIRMLAWSVVLPAASVGAAIALHPLAISAWPALLGLQWARLTPRYGARHAALIVVAHYATLIGAARFVWRSLLGRASGAILYK